MLGTYKRILNTLCLLFSKMMSKLWNIGGLCLIFAIFHSLSSVKGKRIGKEMRQIFNKLEDMNQETVALDPTAKNFRSEEDNKEKEASSIQSGSISNSDSGSRMFRDNSRFITKL